MYLEESDDKSVSVYLFIYNVYGDTHNYDRKIALKFSF